MDPIKCAVLLAKNPTPTSEGELTIELEHMDGSPVSKNESELVDIGQEKHPYRYGIDGAQIKDFTWSLKNTTDDINARWLKRACAVTFRTIGLLTSNRYRQERNTGIYSHFRDEFTKDLHVFDDRPTVLAQAYLFNPNISNDYKGLTQWNDNYYFTPFGDSLEAYMIDNKHYTEGEKDINGNLKLLASQPFLHINMHEKYHAHGGRHDLNSPESIMYPTAKRGYLTKYNEATATITRTLNKKAFIWTNDDIKRWHEDYEKRKNYLYFINRFRAKRLRGRTVKGIPYRVAV